MLGPSALGERTRCHAGLGAGPWDGGLCAVYSLLLPGAAALRPKERARQWGRRTPGRPGPGHSQQREAPRPAGTPRIGERAVRPETLPTAHCANRPKEGARSPAARPARRPAREPRAARPRWGRAARRPPHVRRPTGAQPDPKKPVRDPRGVGEELQEESPTSGVGGRFSGSIPHLAGCLQPVHPAPLLGHTAGQLRQLPQPP